MTFSKLSLKQKTVFKWCHRVQRAVPARYDRKDNPYHAIICDGAVRSGKTICMITSFILWAMRYFDNATFGICGKTVQSAERNIIVPLQSIVDITAYCNVSYTRSNHKLMVTGLGHKNSFYVFGGRDESSYMLIQGITLSGVFFDEVALMPRSFVEQAIARTLSVANALLWFNCNPDNPNHWFYKEWICKADEKKALHLHFLMSDNPTLTPAMIANAESMYSGVFFDRYIKGLWVAAEGVIYRQFSDNPQRWIRDKPDTDIDFISIGIDFGGNRSLTTFVATAVHKNFNKLTVLMDWHIKGEKGTIDSDKVNLEFIAFVSQIKAQYPHIYIRYVFADSEAQYLINGLRKAVQQLNLSIADSAKYPILQRIYCTTTLLNTDRLFICKNCTLVIDGLKSALWDEKHPDERLDDFSSDIDILDAFEYSFERFIPKLTPHIKGADKNKYTDDNRILK